MQDEVPYDDLEYQPDGVFLYNGKPFSGIAYENDDAGLRKCVIAFVDGREHGAAQSFFKDGKLKTETLYDKGRKHGIERAWFDDGNLKIENLFEYGVLMKSKEWLANGVMEKDYARAATDNLYKLVLKERNKTRPSA